jgi:hypothetical protein
MYGDKKTRTNSDVMIFPAAHVMSHVALLSLTKKDDSSVLFRSYGPKPQQLQWLTAEAAVRKALAHIGMGSLV